MAWLILEGHNAAALGALAVAGASDWADGYVAKRWGQASVVGSYLDPAADKVLVGCAVAALAWQVRHRRDSETLMEALKRCSSAAPSLRSPGRCATRGCDNCLITGPEYGSRTSSPGLVVVLSCRHLAWKLCHKGLITHVF